jgi:hypothetical protein
MAIFGEMYVRDNNLVNQELIKTVEENACAEITGVPVVTLAFDSAAGFKNEDIIPYLKCRKKRTYGIMSCIIK